MAEKSNGTEPRDEVLRMAVDVVVSYVGRNQVASGSIPEIITTVFSSLSGLGPMGLDGANSQKPAVSIRKSLSPEFIICLEDGRKLKMLKRHLRTSFQMTPDEYRAKWKLPKDYPMVAPNYAKRRSDFAKEIGLGRKPGFSRN